MNGITSEHKICCKLYVELSHTRIVILYLIELYLFSVILQSFCNPGMQVNQVTVYPSDFGLERMKEEAIHGPPKEIWTKKKKLNNSKPSGALDSDASSEGDSHVHTRVSNR